MIKSIFRSKENYQTLLNRYFDDPNISMDAAGMLAYLLGRPIGGLIDHDDLLIAKSDSKKHTLALIKELKEAGYLEVTQSDDGGTQYIFHEVSKKFEKGGQK